MSADTESRVSQPGRDSLRLARAVAMVGALGVYIFYGAASGVSHASTEYAVVTMLFFIAFGVLLR